MSKVAVDQKNVYFYAETNDALTSYSGDNWMLLFIDADENTTTGWWGYDFLINKNINEKTTSLMKFDANSKEWLEVSRLDYHYEGKIPDIAFRRPVSKIFYALGAVS